MSRVRKAIAIGLIAASFAAGACNKKDDDSERVVRAVDATSPLEHRFTYAVETPSGGELEVQGIIEDDFRFKLQLSLGGKPAIEQVANDDAVAVRFLDTGLVDGFVDRRVADQVDQKTNVPGATVLEALKANRWVLDEAGAPSAVVELREERGPGAAARGESPNRDPLFDARTALAYVRRTARRGPFIRYDEETLNPTYRADEDPFPKPTEASGVIRYDAALFDLPPPSSATAGSTPQLPTELNFRKMAVYVKGGRVIAVREFIGVTPRQLDDLTDYVTALIDATAPEAVKKGFRGQVKALESKPDELGAFLLDGLNTFIVSAGRDPIAFRTMELRLEDFDAVEEQVTLPGDDAILGDLAILQNLGRKPVASPAEGARPAVPQPPAGATDSAAGADA